MSREAAYQALFTVLQGLKPSPFVIVEERLRPWSSVNPAEYPALFMHVRPERVDQRKFEPAVRTLTADLHVYVWTGEAPNVSKRSPLSALLDALDTAMLPDPITTVNTLGGVVSRAWIEGLTEVREEVLSGAALAVVNVAMLIPDASVESAHRFVFDTGNLYADPGDGGAPIRIASLKGITVELTRKNTPHRVSTFPFPTGAGIGQQDITASIESASFEAGEVIRLWFASAPATGATLMRANEVHVIPGPPYVINLTALPVTDDLGVLFSADGTPLGKGSGPAAGEYKLVVPGVYQFNGDDTGKTVAISYLYTDTSGTTLDLSQPTTGASPTLSAVLMGSHAGKQVLLRLRSGVLDFASLPMTLDRFSVHNLKLRALADAQDRVLTMSLQG